MLSTREKIVIGLAQTFIIITTFAIVWYLSSPVFFYPFDLTLCIGTPMMARFSHIIHYC